MKIYPTRPKQPDTDFYADYDKDTTCYGVFGDPSGFCYELYLDKQTAEEKANDRRINFSQYCLL